MFFNVICLDFYYICDVIFHYFRQSMYSTMLFLKHYSCNYLLFCKFCIYHNFSVNLKNKLNKKSLKTDWIKRNTCFLIIFILYKVFNILFTSLMKRYVYHESACKPSVKITGSSKCN